MSQFIKNRWFEAKISDDGQTLETIRFFKANKNHVLDLNDFKEMRNIRTIGNGTKLTTAYGPNPTVPDVILPKHVSKVREYAFAYCPVEEIVWPDDCHTIEEKTFWRSNLEDIHNIGHVKQIGECAFDESMLNSFYVPDGVQSLPNGCFNRASRLSRIDNTEHLEDIGAAAFSHTDLSHFAWPSKCKRIRYLTFAYCRKLSQIDNIQDVDAIEEGAFAECSFASFTFPKKCKRVYEGTFSNCLSLTEIHGLDQVVSIEKNAFFNCSLKEVDLSNSVCSSIGEYAFGTSKKEPIVKVLKKGYFLCDVDETAFDSTYNAGII